MSGVRTGPESDLWSLGALLCAVLSGESPFRRDSLGGILHAVVFDEIRPPPQAAPLLPVVRGLLERDPDRRLDAVEAERLLRAFRETGRTPRTAKHPRTSTGYTPTRRDLPRPRRDAQRTAAAAQDAVEAGGRSGAASGAGSGSGSGSGPDASGPAVALPEQPARQRQQYSTRSVLVAAALVAAMAGAGVSAAALLMREGGAGGGTPGSSAPETPGASSTAGESGRPGEPGRPGQSGQSGGSASPSTSGASGSPGTSGAPSSPGGSGTGDATPTVTRSRAATAPTVPSGYRLAEDDQGFSLAVPDDFTREPQGERVFYMSPGRAIRIGIKFDDPAAGGPAGVMRRAHEKGPSTNPGYRDGRVTETTHDGWPAALWEFTWDGFSVAEGPRHTYDLCWERDGRLYDVWVSAPVGKVSEAKEYFDVAVDTFVRG